MRGGSLCGTMHDTRPTDAHGTGHARPTLRGGHTATHDGAAATAAAGPHQLAAIGVGDEASAAMEADDRAMPAAAGATAGLQRPAAMEADYRATLAAAGATAELQRPAAMEAGDPDDGAAPAAAGATAEAAAEPANDPTPRRSRGPRGGRQGK